MQQPNISLSFNKAKKKQKSGLAVVIYIMCHIRSSSWTKPQ